ncbi:uncharacterized protein LOC116846899 [Odontomachus brunneus]|uniref:uncharacterized protein LOC116846899 n=1 Tax=Odontomachus brunneus TaxID=486640 RepID=UPI0013F1D315|nr:uncharacterized protein LOC116846899 [Odontomachus brunneus]
MKIVVALLALVAKATFELLLTLVDKYTPEDKNLIAYFQRIIAYLQSDEFRTLVKNVEDTEKIRATLFEGYEMGIDVYRYVNQLNDYLHLPHIEPPTKAWFYAKDRKNIRKLLDEAEAIDSVDKLKAHYEKKLKNNQFWEKLIDQFKSDKFQQIVNDVFKTTVTSPEFKELITNEPCVEFLRLIRLLQEMLGIHIPIPPY